MDNDIGIGQVGAQIERLTEQNKRWEIFGEGTSAEPKGYYYLVGPEGQKELVLSKPEWHHENLATPLDLFRFIESHDATDFADAAIFYNECGLVLVYDENDHRNRAGCLLNYSEQITRLMQVAGKEMDQRSFVNLLRIAFHGALLDNGVLIGKLRSIKWSSNQTSNLNHTDESLGKIVQAKIGADDAATFPEELTLYLPVFKEFGTSANVQCAIDVNLDKHTFSLTPYPQEIYRATETALGDIRKLFADAPSMPPIFRGTRS